MTAKAPMPVRTLNLVAPLPHEGTAMRTTDTTAPVQVRSGAVSHLIGSGLRMGDVDSANARSTPLTTPGIRTSTTATRTPTTRSSRRSGAPSADSSFSFSALVQAYLDCRHHKRNTASALAFEERLEANLCALFDELVSGEYRPGRSICFVITRPKPREVWAAEFRDRIVHHVLYNHIAARFHAAFVAGSCACIPGRGTLYGAKRLEADIRSVTQNWSRPAHYLKLDLANFFVAIPKDILFEQLAAKIDEPWWRWLAEVILFHDPRENHELRGRAELLARVPPHKSLFNAPPDTGLPIGNLSSQFFANVHLDALDQFCKHRIGARHYVRYVDDFILLHESPQWLAAAHDRIREFLPARLGAHLNPKKTILQPIARGVDFVGQVIKPWRRTTRLRTLHTCIQRLGSMPAEDLFESGNSCLGMARQASHSHQEQVLIARVLRRRGHVVHGDLSKIYRSHHG
ncbi:MAG TPA: RNA-directed DNA polymerase [Ramlibacter sp.]|nr:RNA-directed DNA polymerase [Ramlibacter sp.]